MEMDNALLSAFHTGTREGWAVVLVSVIDQGKGMAAEELAQLNEGNVFDKVHSGQMMGDGGTGVGLSRTREVLRQHMQSKYFLRSQGLGRGVTLHFSLNLELLPEAKLAAFAQSQFTGDSRPSRRSRMPSRLTWSPEHMCRFELDPTSVEANAQRRLTGRARPPLQSLPQAAFERLPGYARVSPAEVRESAVVSSTWAHTNTAVWSPPPLYAALSPTAAGPDADELSRSCPPRPPRQSVEPFASRRRVTPDSLSGELGDAWRATRSGSANIQRLEQTLSSSSQWATRARGGAHYATTSPIATASSSVEALPRVAESGSVGSVKALSRVASMQQPSAPPPAAAHPVEAQVVAPKPKAAKPKFPPGFCCIYAEDDNVLRRSIVLRVFRPLGIAVVEAVDGVDALIKFASMSESFTGVVLLDNQMPNKTGAAAAAELRRSGWAGPIVGITGDPKGCEDRNAFEAAGLDMIFDKDSKAVAKLKEYLASFAVSSGA
jgi:CheY-like chemotaxis protein